MTDSEINMAVPLSILAGVTPCLVYLCWSDLKHRRLPNLWTLGMLLCASVCRLCTGGLPSLLDGLSGGILAGAFLLLPFLLKGAGGGDVKMLAAAGTVLGFHRVFFLLFMVSVAGLILAVVMLALHKANPARVKHYAKSLFCWNYDRTEGRKNLPPKNSERNRIPFGVAIAAGVWMTLLFEILQAKGGC